jgi:hypothetical protein
MRDAIALASVAPKVTPAPTEPCPGVNEASVAIDVRLRHVSLLAAASRGQSISAQEVMALASAWQPYLDSPALAKLSARALELDVRDVHQQAETLRAGVLVELIELGSSCDGRVVPKSDDAALVRDLASGVRDHLCQKVEAALASINPDRYVSSIHPLEAWERWLTLRTALDCLATHDAAAFFALWNGRVAATVWNWTCAVFNRHPKRAAWVAHMMYLWLAEQAESMGDMRTVVVNRENARIALGA